MNPLKPRATNHSSLWNGCSATQTPVHSVHDGAGMAWEQPPCPGKQQPIAKCSCFTPVLGETKPPCNSTTLSKEVDVAWWCLSTSCCVCCQLLLQIAASSVRAHWWGPAKPLLCSALFNTCWKAPGHLMKRHDPMHWWVLAASLPQWHYQPSAKLLSTDKDDLKWKCFRRTCSTVQRAPALVLGNQASSRGEEQCHVL